MRCNTLPAMQMNAVLDAMLSGKPVVHPIIDKIRACSAMPNLALDFFTHLMHPCPTCRLTATAALHHSYLSACLRRMRSPTQPALPVPPHCLVPADTQQQPKLLRAVRQVASTAGRPVAAPVGAVARLLHNGFRHVVAAVSPSTHSFVVPDQPLLSVSGPEGQSWSTVSLEVDVRQPDGSMRNFTFTESHCTDTKRLVEQEDWELSPDLIQLRDQLRAQAVWRQSHHKHLPSSAHTHAGPSPNQLTPQHALAAEV